MKHDGLVTVSVTWPVAVDNAAMEAEPPQADPPNRQRRWFQFSLRTLKIGVTLLASLVPSGRVSLATATHGGGKSK